MENVLDMYIHRVGTFLCGISNSPLMPFGWNKTQKEHLTDGSIQETVFVLILIAFLDCKYSKLRLIESL